MSFIYSFSFLAWRDYFIKPVIMVSFQKRKSTQKKPYLVYCSLNTNYLFRRE